MVEQEQNILSLSLIKLQEELTTFSEVHGALKGAHEELIKAEQEWKQLTEEQQQTASQLVGATENAIVATNAVTVQAETMAGALIPLAKAIENVNFPLRLDKIDMAVSTQASTLAAVQGTTERHFNGLHDRIGKNDENMSSGFAVAKKTAEAARKMNIIIILLLILNLLLVAGGLALFLIRRG